VQDVIASAATWFEQQRREHLAATVEYRPSVGLTRSCRATLVVGRWEAISKDGQVVRLETKDFLIHRDELAQDPKRGDRIAVTENGSEKVYEVSIPAGADYPWRWSDRKETLRRIHTHAVQGAAVANESLLVRAVGVSSNAAITDSQIASQLILDLGVSRAVSRTLTPASQYVYVVLPADFGVPNIRLNGFVSTAWELSTRPIAFDGQDSRPYDVYRSTYSITGTATVEVS